MKFIVKRIILEKIRRKLSYADMEQITKINKYKIRRILNELQEPNLDDIKKLLLIDEMRFSTKKHLQAIDKLSLLNERQIDLVINIIDEITNNK